MKKEWKVYIRGNKDRGEEVIKALIDLGAKNSIPKYEGKDSTSLYYIRHDGEICIESEESEYGKIIMDNYREIILPGHWEDGDILIRTDRIEENEYTVFRKYSHNNMFYNYDFLISIDRENHLWSRISGEEKLYKTENFRLATSEEIKQFHDLLHKMNRDWDSEKKHLVKLKQIPTLEIIIE